MWQVFYFIAVEHEHEVQRELDRRRRLTDALRPVPRGRIGRVVRRGRELVGEVVDHVGSVLDRPLIGPHHL